MLTERQIAEAREAKDMTRENLANLKEKCTSGDFPEATRNVEMKPALLVIDMQNGFLNPESPFFISGAAETVPACRTILSFCRSALIPVFFVTRSYTDTTVEKCRFQAWNAGGHPLSEGCAPELSADMPFEILPGDYHIVKPRYSAFFATGLDLILRRLGIDHLVLAGTTTPNCIRTTAYDGLSLDYDVTVLSDCTSSISPEVQQSNLDDMQRAGIEIVDSRSYRERLSKG